MSDFKKALIEKLDNAKQLQPADDGYVVYWTCDNTYLTALDLRCIANEMDRRNHDWHQRVLRDVGKTRPKVEPVKEKPCKKKRFGTEKEARDFDRNMRVYYCSGCEAWHLTSDGRHKLFIAMGDKYVAKEWIERKTRRRKR